MPIPRKQDDGDQRSWSGGTIRAVPTLVVAALVLPVAACAGDGGPETSPSPTVTEPEREALSTVGPSTLAAPESATTAPARTKSAESADDAAGHAISAMKRYLRAVNELSLDRSMPLAELDGVATDDALEWATYTVSTARENGWTITGERTFDEIDVTGFELDPTASQNGHPTVHLDACLDSTAVDALDDSGDSVLPASRRTRLATHWSVWRIDSTWIVAKTGFVGENPEVDSCA